jgi:hypothetical protein
VVTSETRVLGRLARNQRTWVHVNVRNVGVGRVGVCMLCVCDSEECGVVYYGTWVSVWKILFCKNGTFVTSPEPKLRYKWGKKKKIIFVFYHPFRAGNREWSYGRTPVENMFRVFHSKRGPRRVSSSFFCSRNELKCSLFNVFFQVVLREFFFGVPKWFLFTMTQSVLDRWSNENFVTVLLQVFVPLRLNQ